MIAHSTSLKLGLEIMNQECLLKTRENQQKFPSKRLIQHLLIQ